MESWYRGGGCEELRICNIKKHTFLVEREHRMTVICSQKIDRSGMPLRPEIFGLPRCKWIHFRIGKHIGKEMRHGEELAMIKGDIGWYMY